MKRFLAILLALCLAASLIPMVVSAEVIAEGKCSADGSLRWQMSDNGTLIIYGTGAMSNYRTDLGLNGADWAEYSGGITKVIVKEGVTSIGKGAFYQCSSLKSVELASSVKEIGEYAFAKTSLENIVLPTALETIGKSAFHRTLLKELTIPEKVNTVSGGMFQACNRLVSVTFLGAVVDIGGSAFSGCEMLESVVFKNGLSGEIGNQAFGGCEKLAEFQFHEGIEKIEEMAFFGCEALSAITLPDSLKSLGESAFRETGLVSVTIPQNVEYIGNDPFCFCYELKNITVYSESMEGLRGTLGGEEALEYIHIIGNAPQSEEAKVSSRNEDFVIYYDEGTSGWEPPTWKGYILEVWGKEDTSKTGSCGENLTWLLDEGVLTISGTGAMDDYSMDETPWNIYKHRVDHVVIEDGVTSIGKHAFYRHENLLSVSIAGSVETIGNNAFNDCYALKEIVIPDGVRSIGEYVFWYCTSLTSVTMTDSVEEIGGWAFTECNELKSVRLSDNITVLPQSLFHACGYLETINIPKKLTVIEDGAFYGCANVCAVTLPETLVTLEDSAFRQTGLVEVVIPASVTHFEGSVFANCQSLTKVQFLGDAPIFAYDAFQNATVVCVYPSGNATWTEEVRQDYNGSVVWISDDHVHTYSGVTVAPSCTEQGCMKYTCTECGYSYCDNIVEPLGHDLEKVMCGEYPRCLREGCDYVGEQQRHNYIEDTPDFYVCEYCQEYSFGCRIYLDGTELAQQSYVWVDGQKQPVTVKNGSSYVNLRNVGPRTLVTYTFNDPNAADRHTQYPTGMKVWLLSEENGEIKLTYIKEFDNLLQYSGSSIRITGKKGIRMITSIEKDKRNALIGSGLAGYTLVEYGTILGWANVLAEDSVTLHNSEAKSNYAYKKGVADPIYKDTGKLIQYTNVLVGFYDDQCIPDLIMRPYIILEDSSGERLTLYGGCIYRNIGYIAYQNRNAFAPNTNAYNYVWSIIHHVYGDQYDAEYKG